MMVMVLGSGWGAVGFDPMEVRPWLDPLHSNNGIEKQIQHNFGHWGRSFEAQSRHQTKPLKLLLGIS
jgi:hypothetical protein